MKGLTTPLLSRACRVFLTHAYPGGPESIPPNKRAYLNIQDDQPLESLLTAPVCCALPSPGGGFRGYAFRLGSDHYPHLKLHAVGYEDDGSCVFMVDTHDALRLQPTHPDAEQWAQIQASNRRVKEEIERAWEADGLLTFNGLLRRELDRAGPRPD